MNEGKIKEKKEACWEVFAGKVQCHLKVQKAHVNTWSTEK